jgi:hypothetical protein
MTPKSVVTGGYYKTGGGGRVLQSSERRELLTAEVVVDDVDLLRGAGHRYVEQSALLGLSTVLKPFELLVVRRKDVDVRRFQPLRRVDGPDAHLSGVVSRAAAERALDEFPPPVLDRQLRNEVVRPLDTGEPLAVLLLRDDSAANAFRGREPPFFRSFLCLFPNRDARRVLQQRPRYWEREMATVIDCL